MSFDNAYESLTEGDDDARWAFGTGFVNPLAGVDTRLPVGVDPGDLEAYCLMLGDDALILSHRLQEWVTNAPELEDEVALANIALDLLGQARMLLTRAATAAPGGDDGPARGSEDDYAFLRAEHEFRNVRLAELDNGDFAFSIARLLVMSSWRLAMTDGLRHSADPVLAAIAAKAVKEITYHRDYAAQWTVRLGDGTEYSRARMSAALADVWPYVPELFRTHHVEERLTHTGVAVDPRSLRDEVEGVLNQVLTAATLQRPDTAPRAGVAGRTGRDGIHTESFGYALAELQSVARAHPGATW
ncbi:phenylacetate-CoA oxygenase subunit PaaC [Spiractinospora alimapuensis]|uniref:1,2-phenylacetyl-CoA epoxidase subunit PaaC n=1 Tax=Spiractinospora alimapuensis TaxID=2820884 RepID=UPI001F27D956|nr:1,2-phenylacetyl-CoA epoxidase subunit PaaC [Spiractinospora alimapuensis]QVQ54274.1 phenylacetate-CoA oxygenase subunit PaaC [Spiractinospora alimapuensis]